MANCSGLLGLSGVSGDIRDLRTAAEEGNEEAKLALDVYVSSVRHYLGAYLGAYLVEMGGADAIVFTGGIGENGSDIRAQVCANLEEFGIELDAEANKSVSEESQINASGSRVSIWVVPTNEEIVVARQTQEKLLTLGN